MPRRVAIIGAGVSGLGAAWALNRHPERFDFRLYEAQAQVGGNANPTSFLAASWQKVLQVINIVNYSCKIHAGWRREDEMAFVNILEFACASE